MKYIYNLIVTKIDDFYNSSVIISNECFLSKRNAVKALKERHAKEKEKVIKSGHITESDLERLSQYMDEFVTVVDEKEETRLTFEIRKIKIKDWKDERKEN